MKKKVRTSNNNPFYSNEPAVSRGQMADKSMTQNASLGNAPPKMVDKKPGRSAGLGAGASHHRPPAKGMQGVPQVTPLKSGPAKPSPVPKQGGGNLRGSGHPGAHRLGSVGSIKLKV